QSPVPSELTQCMSMSRTMFGSARDREYPEEWTYDEKGVPTRTAFVKWDWGKDDDDSLNEPVIPPPVPDNQLTMPFIFDEIGVKQTVLTGEELTFNPKQQ